jgi:hypothetical protein
MKAVWQEMQRQARMADKAGELAGRLAALDRNCRMEHWGVSDIGVSLPDQACAAFFCYAITKLGKRPVKSTYISEHIGRWRAAARECHNALVGEFPISAEVKKALSTVQNHFESQASFVEQVKKDNPYFIDRSKGEREDKARATCKALAMGTRAIFGSFLYRSLATVATVMFGTKIDWERVRDWCSDLPSANKGAA